MKKINLTKTAVTLMWLAVLCVPGYAEKLILLHTNDTHSTIEPLADGTGGIIQRKAIIDSIRKKEKNVVLIDAGDVVQGTLFFNYFGGDVEYPLMDMAGYDIRILGNHEFDNGPEDLAKRYKNVKGRALSANYDFTGTELEGIFEPYTIRQFDGKKIGFIGINIDPESIIAHKNVNFKFKEIMPVANDLASHLKRDLGCDLVVAVSHIGYEKVNDKTTDVELAQASKDIDIIIGGHTHTLIDPNKPEEYPSLIENAEGRMVRVAQTGKQGRFLGKIEIDLDDLSTGDGRNWNYSLIPVTDRFSDEELDSEMIAFLQPYREKVDSVNRVVVAHCAYTLEKERLGGLANMTADFGYEYTNQIADSLRERNPEFPRVDMSIMNVGGIRHEMPAGEIYEGQILATYPFSNKVNIIKVKGEDVIEALRVSAGKGGEAVSGNVIVVTDPNGELLRVMIDGREMDPDKDYIIGTIDYVAEGNDDLRSLARHTKLWEGDEELSAPILRWVKGKEKAGIMVNPDPRPRFVTDIKYDTK